MKLREILSFLRWLWKDNGIYSVLIVIPDVAKMAYDDFKKEKLKE